MEYSVNLNPKWQPLPTKHWLTKKSRRCILHVHLLSKLLIDHFRTNMRKFCHIAIGKLYKQTYCTLHLLNILDILTLYLYQHNDLKFFCIYGTKACLSGSIPKSFSICKQYTWIQHQICSQQVYVNLERVITLENKQMLRKWKLTLTKQ